MTHGEYERMNMRLSGGDLTHGIGRLADQDDYAKLYQAY